MNLIYQTPSLNPQWVSVTERVERIRLQIDPEPISPEIIVNNLASIEGPVDIYCWYEGPQCLPKSGADFMKNFIFEPLYKLKQNAKTFLYSLNAWDFKKNSSAMSSYTPLGETINRINKAVIECIYSSSFFKYCTQIRKENGVSEFLNKELPKKNWLFSLSENRRKKGMTIAELFNKKSSLFDWIKDKDVSAAYSLMQYVEGYYLIQESVKKGLLNGQKKIQIAFVLPNDESKYYLDYPKDIKKLLQVDFGEELKDMDINISFHFFKYGESLDSRPYINKGQAPKVGVKDIDFYFKYLSQPLLVKEQPNKPFLRDVIHSPPKEPFLRDVIHDINGWKT